jgi:hypothetical protein
VFELPKGVNEEEDPNREVLFAPGVENVLLLN